MFLVLQFVFCSLLQTGFSHCPNCEGRNLTCVEDQCLPRCVSVMSSGECLQCLESRFYGKECEKECPNTCLNSTCQTINSRVMCIEGCVEGKKGDRCNVNCPSRCVQCERNGDECIGPCRDSRFYGTQCDIECPNTCLNFTCQLNNSGVVCTEGCVDGKKGDQCSMDCPISCTQCERYGDWCTGPCASSLHFGDKCDNRCPGNCREGCNRSGECHSCKPGYRGLFCNVTCPSKCIQCDRNRMRCVGPCASPMFHGDLCDKKCLHCSCGCDRETGRCVKHNAPCSLHGKDSGTSQTATVSTTGSKTLQTTPVSSTGSKTSQTTQVSSTGSKTSQTTQVSSTVADVTDTLGNVTAIRLINVIYGFVAGIWMVGLIIVSRKIFYRFRKRSNRQPVSATSADQSDQSQYWATKYWEIKDEDLDSDSFTNKPQPGIHGRCPSSVQQIFDAGLVSQENNCFGSEPDRDRQQVPGSCFLNGQFSDEDSVMENHLYTSAEACGACALNMDVRSGMSTSTCQSEKIKARKTVERRPSQAEQIVKNGSDVSVTSQDLELRRKGDTLIMWEQNVDLSKVYVKYITPNMADDDP